MSAETTKTLKQRVIEIQDRLPRYSFVKKVIAWLKENGHEELANKENIKTIIYNVAQAKQQNEPITLALEAIVANK